MKKILVTGANSYIGDSVKEYLMSECEGYQVDIKDTIGWEPQKCDFEEYDVVFNVAGIAHIRESDENRQLYYEVNRDLAIAIAQNAKAAGVSQYILLSSMSVYGINTGTISKETPVSPINAYGKSKAQADEAIAEIAGDGFRFVCLRPPMVYGKGCKGNYQRLRKFALKSPIFPNYANKRSMIYIGNLCEFVRNCVDEQRSGLFIPQNAEYVCTSNMVKLIAEKHKKKIKLVKIFNFLISIIDIGVMKKVFGNLCYEKVDLVGKYSFDDSITLSES